MKKILPVLMMLVLLFVSCDLFGGSDSESATPISNHRVVIDCVDTSKGVSSTPKSFILSSSVVTPEDYQNFKTTLNGKKIIGLHFYQITDITAVFTDTTIKNITADAKMKFICSKAFELSQGIETVSFDGSVTIQNDTFYSSITARFTIPKSSVADYKAKYPSATFEEKEEGFNVNYPTDMMINYPLVGLDASTSFKQGITSFKVDNNAVGQYETLGYVIEGFYADEKYETAKLFNGDGTIVSGNVSGYVKDGKWACSKGSVTLYAKSAKLITITLDKNGGTSDGVAKIAIGDTALRSLTHVVGSGSGLDFYSTLNTEYPNLGDVVIDNDGNLRKGVAGYTDENGKWICKKNVTLYAHYLTGAGFEPHQN